MKRILPTTWHVVLAALAVLSGGVLLSSCGVQSIKPLATTPKTALGQTGVSALLEENTCIVTPLAPESGRVLTTPAPQDANTRTAKPEFDAFGIITHKNAIPDSYVVQFKDEMVVDKGQNRILNMDRAKNIATMVVEENQLKTVKMGHVFNAAIRGFAAKMTQKEAAVLVKDPRVLLVEQDAYVHANAVFTNPGWALDRIDQANPTLNNSFATTLTGAGVHIYNLDEGALPTHVEFAGRIQCGATNSPDIQGACQGDALRELKSSTLVSAS